MPESQSSTSAVDIAFWLSLLGFFAFFKWASKPLSAAERARAKQFEGLPVQHELEARRHIARAGTTSCSRRGLQSLLHAQTAFVHAAESGHAELLARALRRRDELLEKLSSQCQLR